jgi:protein-S-isoprenylcysteine O-methyltransferase Ste14
MTDDVAHKRGWQIFEVVFGVPFLVAIILQLAAPIHFPKGLFMPARILAGVILIAVGIYIVVLARREFILYSQPTDPGLSTTRIITTGVFSYSRNPLYLGGIFFLTGVSLVFNLPWALILLVPSIVACHYILIAPEESYLRAKFGEQFQAYAAAVHRWIGRK